MGLIDDAVAAIAAGLPVVIPTDTVYGLVSTAATAEATARIQRLKGRGAGQPLALLAGGIDGLFENVPELDGRAQAIVRALLPGPYTLVLANPARRFPWLNGGSTETIGVRVPTLAGAALAVLGRAGAVVSTSANLHGGPAPARLTDIPAEIRAACAAVLDGGTLPGTASTVLDFSMPEPRVLREGAAPSGEAIARALAALVA